MSRCPSKSAEYNLQNLTKTWRSNTFWTERVSRGFSSELHLNVRLVLKPQRGHNVESDWHEETCGRISLEPSAVLKSGGVLPTSLAVQAKFNKVALLAKPKHVLKLAVYSC